MSRRRREMYIGHARLCVCLSVRSRIPTLLHGLGCNLGNGRGCPLVVHYWADVQSVHGGCVAMTPEPEREMPASACTRCVTGCIGAGVRALPVQASAGLQLVEPGDHHRGRLRQQRPVQLHRAAEVARSTQDDAQSHHSPARETVGVGSLSPLHEITCIGVIAGCWGGVTCPGPYPNWYKGIYIPQNCHASYLKGRTFYYRCRRRCDQLKLYLKIYTPK